MGYYIPGPTFGKAEMLIREWGGEVVESPAWPPPEGKVYVCVVANYGFEAAAIAFDKRECDDFDGPDDHRPKTWVSVPVGVAIAADPRVAEKLNLV